MQKISLILAATLALASTTEVSAQQNVVRSVGYLVPQTTLNVDITVCKEEITKGIYAKYASQYLGVMAPLSDKVSYSITSSSLGSVTDGDISDIYLLETDIINDIATDYNSKESTIKALPLQPCNKAEEASMSVPGMSSAGVKSVQEMAQATADAIYTLRRRRFDLITGELGENVFGEGLRAAIEEMSRLENEYLSLFVGTSKKSYKTYSYSVTPKKGTNSYVVARFSQNEGLTDPININGDPIVITTAAEGIYKTQPAPVQSKFKGSSETITYRVADNALCKLFCASELLDSKRIAILQYGGTVEKIAK